MIRNPTRAGGQSCRSCEFWGAVPTSLNDRVLAEGIDRKPCVRHAPVRIDLGRDVHRMGTHDFNDRDRAWPLTTPEEWCGDFQPLEVPPDRSGTVVPIPGPTSSSFEIPCVSDGPDDAA